MGSLARQLTDVQQRLADAKARLREKEAALEQDRYLDKIRRAELYSVDQVACDDALSVWGGRRAPAPRSFETRNDYRRRLIRLAGRFLPPDHDLKHVLDERADDERTDKHMVGIFFPQIMAAVKKAVKCVDTVPEGSLRPIVERDMGGREIVSYVGRRPFTDNHHQPNRRVVAFVDRHGDFPR
jgi:hypothetical protein